MHETYTVRFLPDGPTVTVPSGVTLLDAQRTAGLRPDSPCGGRGTCGKCTVTLFTEEGSRPVLACQTFITSNLEVMPVKEVGASVLTQGMGRHVTPAPLIDALSLSRHPYLMAFDLGTTTLAGYLLDAVTGELCACTSQANPQATFGADVISRMEYAERQGAEPLQTAIRTGMREMMEEATTSLGVSLTDLVLVCVVGNPCMHHLFLGLPTASLAKAPYSPALCESLQIPATTSGLPIHPEGRLLVLPNLAGFVGADTVACMLAAEFDTLEPLTLLLDIGTNGEMVLGNRNRRVACSTAAGPAFEGAKLECGMRGAPGAIDHVSMEGGILYCHVLGDGKPLGICGSGVVDAAAVLAEAGVITPSGRMADPEDLTCSHPEEHLRRMIRFNGKPAYVLAFPEETAHGSHPILLTQKDIRELQLAKAALAAGIRLLADHLGVALEAIEQVFLAGAFGNYLSPVSACGIGLLPPELLGRVVPVGNAAGEGAKLAAVSGVEFARCQALAEHTEYLELATHPKFQDIYLDAMSF